MSVWILAAALTIAGLPETSPAPLGLDPALSAQIDAAVGQAIAQGQVPGAVVIIGRNGKIAHVSVQGDRARMPAVERMTRDTIFDMASLTKPIATATTAMTLIEQKRLRLDQTLGELLPEFDNHGKGAITVEQLLRHRTGLIPDNPMSDYEDGVERAWENLANLDLKGAPGETFLYSDVNFIILGRIIEKVTGQTLDVAATERVFGPMGLVNTRFRRVTADTGPLEVDFARTAPTESIEVGGVPERRWVHDPRSRALGGVAGHAGLFSTADDVAVYAQTLLNGGVAPNGTRVLDAQTVRLMMDPGSTPEGERRGLGWDVATGFSSPRGSVFGLRGVGHTGFTGTSLWIDPPTRTFVVLLTSRLHPNGKGGSPTRLRRLLADLTARAIVEPPFPPSSPAGIAPVRCGIDVLADGGCAPLQGKRVGLVTNHTGRTRDGRSTIDVLHSAPGVKLTALFSPEHGIRGAVDEKVGDGKDEATGLPIYSLYGETRKPSPEQLADLDVLVYDIQDVGCRFYTYISTLGLVMEAAKERGIPVVVLDRPNPFGGLAIGGPVREKALESFIAHEAIPLQHGLTVGELAQFYNKYRPVGCELSVIACEGWSRDDLYDRTGLLWVNPSPNMRSLTEAILYPGVGMLEATNLATGRGTDTPFERVGAPWIDPVAFATALNSLGLPGLRFVPIRFTPTARQFEGQDCGGVFIQITRRDRVDPIALGVGMAKVLRRLYPNQWETENLRSFVANSPAFEAIVSDRTLEETLDSWAPELEAYRAKRESILIYRD
jgi:uncharacterized protein YbbC (DUF1343 family)/CubicO group peptidase (beta-lactamase class C family)